MFASIFSLILLARASDILLSSHFTAYTLSTPSWIALLKLSILDIKVESYLLLDG